MQADTLPAALGQLIRIPQFFVWRLTWDAEAGKYNKVPWRDGWPIDAQQPAAWLPYEQALQQLQTMRAAGETAALGWMMTPGCGYWFLDIDKCIEGGRLTELATQLATMLPGCFMEYSSSGNGLHIIGHNTLPEHSKRNKAHDLELYTEGRGIAFGMSGQAWGCADESAPAVLQIAAHYFPPRTTADDGEFLTPRSDWAGPADDAELLQRAMQSSSIAAKAGQRATFAMLWENSPELDRFYSPGSERDAALASHLAFWTGCDAPRMERLMRQSKLYREKWDAHRTYLRELTIINACANQKDVLKDRPRVDVNAEMYGAPAPAAVSVGGLQIVCDGWDGDDDDAPAAAPAIVVPLITDEMAAKVDSLLDLVGSAGTWKDIHNHVIPAIRAAGVPPALMPRLETAVNKRLDMFDAKLSIAKLRALLNPPRVAAPDGDETANITRPEWAANYVYLRQQDAFFNLAEALAVSRAAFSATHDRQMPIKGDGPDRLDACRYMLQHWDTPIVHDTMYWPGAPAIAEHDGLKWANLYNENTHPATAAAYTVEGVAGIDRFQRLLWLQCGQRERVYLTILAWMAHNVQHPGRKIRWVPIIKGVEGDGKSTIAAVMQAALGWRNTMTVGPELVTAQGGFTDWAHGNAVVALEEIYVSGRERYKVVNTLKQFVSNNTVSIHPKGGAPKKVINTCNQIAFTNHTDAIPLDDKGDRRWYVVFTPFADRWALFAALGVTEAREHFDPLYHSIHNYPGEWRKWLLEMQIPAWFDADGAAQITEEKATMSTAGIDDIEMLCRDLIEAGAVGICRDVVSSSCFSHNLRTRSFTDGVDVPKTNSLHHMFLRLGYLRVDKPMWWDNKTHRVWVRNGVDSSPENLRKLLDATKR